jgi:ParB-like chromosome segregation protein Spo0J
MTTWTELLKIPDDPYAMPAHPAAALFPLMPDDELRDLADDIKVNKLREPILVYEGKVVDGRNRLKACQLAGVEPEFKPPHLDWNGDLEKQLFDLVLSYNLHRRHLTPQQRRDVIAAVLKHDPKRSNRRVAKQTKTDHKTVAAVRTDLEGRGEIPHVEVREDSRGRAQPSQKPPATPHPPPVIDTDAAAAEDNPDLAPAYREVQRRAKPAPDPRAGRRRSPRFFRLPEEVQDRLRHHKVTYSDTQMAEMQCIGPAAQMEVAGMVVRGGGNTSVREAKDALLREMGQHPLEMVKRIVPRLSPEQRAELRQWLDSADFLAGEDHA